MQVWINYCTHFLFFFLAKYKETEDDSQILYHSNINRYYRQWNEENTNMGKSSCSWWHHHLSLGFSFWSNLYMLHHIFTVDITSYPTFFFFFFSSCSSARHEQRERSRADSQSVYNICEASFWRVLFACKCGGQPRLCAYLFSILFC